MGGRRKILKGEIQNMDNFYKHYIRLNENNQVIKAFSEAFEQPEAADILLTDKGIRQCNIDLHDMAYSGAPKWKWDGKALVEATAAEKAAWQAKLPPAPPSQEELIKALQTEVATLKTRLGAAETAAATNATKIAAVEKTVATAKTV